MITFTVWDVKESRAGVYERTDLSRNSKQVETYPDFSG